MDDKRTSKIDMQVRPAFELELQLRELQRQAGIDVKPDFDTFENAYLFVNVCKDPSLLSKASVYLTDHATVMLKIIIAETTSSVDIGREEFTYAIVNTKTANTRMGRGHTDDLKAMKDLSGIVEQVVKNDLKKDQMQIVKESLAKAFDELHSGKIHHDARNLFKK